MVMMTMIHMKTIMMIQVIEMTKVTTMVREGVQNANNRILFLKLFTIEAYNTATTSGGDALHSSFRQ